MLRACTLLLCLFTIVIVACSDSRAETLYPTVEVRVERDGASATVVAEIAHLPDQRRQGLMLRQELAPDAGMLFLYADDHTGGFWMRNTYIPLDIAFIDADSTVVDIRQGRPLDETLLAPDVPYRYVLEVNEGWFARHGLGIGASVTVPVEELPAAE